jgi:signal recognition particle receptor subunit beta
MVELNHRERTIKVKIVYYGPPVGGKTTNLQVLHHNAGAQRRGELVSINSAQDRTILFDLLPLKTPGFRGFDLRLQVLAVPGQAMYAATRRLVLKGADSLVFVANSAADRWEENVQSFREMTENLLAHQLDPAALPLVLQYNKRDLPETTPVEFMDRTLNARKIPAIAAVATQGEGVLETFSAILSNTIQDLSTRYQIVDVARGKSLEAWTKQTMVGLFGATTLGHEAPGAAPETRSAIFFPPKGAEVGTEDQRNVRITLPEETVRTANVGPSARANETLVESYAQASARLSNDLAEMRDERDRAERRLDEVRQALRAAQDILAGQPLEAALRAVLVPMAESAGAAHASMLVPSLDRTFRAAALRGLDNDPLLKVPGGVRHVTDRFFNETEAKVHRALDSLDLGEALGSAEPAFGAVLSVPIRTPRGLQAAALLYFSPDDALPGESTLDHLNALASALSASIELAAAMEAGREAERNLHLALLGTASLHGMENALSSLLLVRDRLGAMRRRPDAPRWFHEEFAKLTPGLSDALSTGRSMVAFSRGEIEKEVVELDEVLEDLRAAGLDAQVGPGAGAVLGDAVLIRLALLALLDEARDESGGQPRMVAVAEGGRVKLRVASAAPADAGGSRQSAANLRMAFVQKVARLHGGHVTQETDGSGAAWTTLSLLPAY